MSAESQHDDPGTTAEREPISSFMDAVAQDASQALSAPTPASDPSVTSAPAELSSHHDDPGDTAQRAPIVQPKPAPGSTGEAIPMAVPAPAATTDTTNEPVMSPGHAAVPVATREDAHTQTGSTAHLSWGARTDVGLVREHNEDSFLVRAPVFAVCDGMGGHAAGEVASAIAVETIAELAPLTADDALLGASVERANEAIIEAAANGRGRLGMGCTSSCALIEGNRLAIAHVGDSRVYLLHRGTLVRLTHDHSYVEELVEAGEITADEARVHPSRSVITRALGNDPDMYADHFGLDITAGDRVILCSDGLSSMIEDSEIEGIAVSSATPQAAADNLVAAALTAGGHDNVSVVVVDVVDDGVVEAHRRAHFRRARNIALAVAAVIAALIVVAVLFVRSSWYVGVNGTTVGIYRGVRGSILGIPTSTLVDATSVEISDLPEAVRKALSDGVRVGSEEEAEATVKSYREQIDADKTSAAETAGRIGEANGTIAPAPDEGAETGRTDSDSGDVAEGGGDA